MQLIYNCKRLYQLQLRITASYDNQTGPKSEPEFPMKGSGTTPRDSSKLRVEVLYEALLVQHKCGPTQTISSI